MWGLVGIVRTTKRLERALRRITLLQQEIDEYYHHFRLSNNLLELRNWCRWLSDGALCATEKREPRAAFYPRLSGFAP